MSNLVLVAASGLAREVLALLHAQGRRVEALLDDDPDLHGQSVDGVPVAGGLEMVKEHAGAELLVCAGKGSARRRIVHRLNGLGVEPDRFAAVVHPSVEMPRDCTLGRGTIVLAHAVLTTNVHIGEHVVVMPHVTLTHDNVVEDFATLCSGVTLGGGVRVGSGAYLGMGSCVRERVTVGRDSLLGMGAALVGDLPAHQTWAGVPARVIDGPDSEVS